MHDHQVRSPTLPTTRGQLRPDSELVETTTKELITRNYSVLTTGQLG